MKRFAIILALFPIGLSAQTAQEEADKGFLVELLEDNLSGDERTVSITGFQGALSSEASLSQLTVADSEGIWLTLTDVVLDWNRSALLRGAIEVETLSAAEINVARAPVSQSSAPAAEAQPFSLPELPVSINLGALRVDRLLLGDSFVGEPLTLNIEGAAQLGGGEGNFDLRAERLEGNQGLFALVGAFENATRTLQIDLDLSEGPNGLIAGSLGLPAEPSVQMILTGNAPLDDFAADLSIATDGIDRLSGAFSLASAEGGQTFGLDVGGDVTTLFAPEYREFFGPDVGLIASGRAPDSGGFELNALELSTANLQLSGTATIGADGFPEAFDLDGQIQGTDGDIVLLPLSGPKTFVQGANLNISFDASNSDAWTADIVARNYDRPGVLIEQLELQGGGVIRSETGEVTANLTYGARGLTLDDGNLSEALGDEITGNLSVEAISGAPTRIPELRIIGAGVEILADATLIPVDPGLQIKSTIITKADDLSRFAGLTGIDLAGSGEVTLISDIDPLNGLYDVLLSGDTQNLATGIAQLDPLLKGQGNLSAQAVRDTEGTRLEALRIETREATILANANLTNDGGRGDFSIDLGDLSKAEPSLNGPAQIAGTATLKPDQALDFDIDLTASSDRITLGGTSTPTPDGRTLIADADFDIDELARFASIASRDIAGAASGTGNFVLLADQTRFTTDLTLNTQDLQTGTPQLDPLFTGFGTWQVEAARTGETRFRLPKLIGETPWLQIEASAAGDIDSALGASAKITLPDASRIAPGLPGALTLDAQAERFEDQTARIEADIAGQGTQANLTANIATPDEDLNADISLALNVQSLSPFSTLAGQQLSGAIAADVSGNIQPDLSKLDLSLSATSSNLSVGIDAADKLLRGNGRYDLALRRDGSQIEISRLDAQTANASITGVLNAEGDTGSADFSARVNDIGLFTDELSGPVTASGNATRLATGWRLDVDATGPGGITAQTDGTVADSGRLDLAVTGALPLALANDILDPRRVSGVANVNLRVAGPAALSSVSGVITTQGARLAAPTLGQALENIDTTINLRGGTADIAATAEVQSGGQLNINGPVALTSPFDAQLAARISNLELRDPQLYETQLSGRIDVTGPLAGGARITGDVDIGSTEIRVPSSGIGALGALPTVTHIGASQNVQQTINRAGASQTGGQSESSSAAGPDFPVDITVNAPSRIFIRGRGLDAELGGQLNLGGSTNNIVPNGQFNLVRGRLDILQQRFNLSEGSASLQGDFEPYIRLVARTEAATGTRIEIVVDGPATEPVVSFNSTPELPQDEVLSQLIFGRNLTDISPLQAVQLAAAIGTLAGRGGNGVIDNFRQDLNLDDFDVTTDEEGNAAVRAGAYLSENVYTDVTVSSDGTTEINLNLDITDEISARGSVDDDGETSIGIFFQRDY